ncbi:MAG: DUF3089 domain-containing protein [Bacteroidetes bacterium]|nr:DUF3089 domain-containing protein [Bacteroidota bacterium]
MKSIIFVCLALILLQSCASVRPFSSNSVPSPPDYSNPDNWAALPTVSDMADRTPGTGFQDLQATAQVDVFFMHPTIFTEKSDKSWNASLTDNELNQDVDESTILFQASAFNGAGRVYAPRYRQAHYRCYFSKDKASSEQALELAYQDMKAAFEYYLQHYNQGRPIILAAHSQGTQHGKRLLAEFFDEKPLKNKLVTAYLVGWPILRDTYKTLPPCETPDQTGCICSWRSFIYGYQPRIPTLGDNFLVTNPLTWTTDKTPAPKTLNEGTVLRDLEKVYPQIADAQAHDGILWVHKPKFPGSFFFRLKNYHIADYNLFYVNVRKNAQRRVDAFWK